jgi:succinate dehydrogenase/fumarate reductase flavoprotein subunit
MSNEKEQKGLSRRSFLRNTGLGVAATAGAGILGSQTAAAQEDGTAQEWSFETSPDPIPDSEISETVEADIIIVGAGVSGVTAASAAVENGAKVVLIAASSAPVYRGGSFHAVYSSYMEAQSIEPYDVGKVFRRELSAAGYMVDEDKWWKFAQNSPDAMNWLIEKMEAAGYLTVIEVSPKEPDGGPMDTPMTAHSWATEDEIRGGYGAEFVVKTMAADAEAGGAEFRYNTIAKQLVREDDNTGRVTAVIAQAEDGTYTKYVGTKAIILATGDFSADKEMMAKYCPMALPLLSDAGDLGYDNNVKYGGLFPGDGQKMGLWVGAAWQKTTPNPPMIMGGVGPTPSPYGGSGQLTVNKHGDRFGNEDVTGPFMAYSQMQQPNMETYALWSSNFAEAAAPWYSFTQLHDADPIPPEQILEGWKTYAEAGYYATGDTIEEVIEQLGLPAEETKATVERYNALCEAGVDEDCFKRKDLLIGLTEGPFYGVTGRAPTFLTVMGGLRTNSNMQVCDENDEPIPGLYNLGVMVGDYFANMYTFRIPGNNLGANCMTFGYLTGRDIANGTLA